MELLAKHDLDPKGSNFCRSNGATERQNPNPNCNLIFIPIGS